MRKLYLFLFSFIIIFQGVAQNTGRYWVNGSGNWNDPQHWSVASGGNAGASIPLQENDVIFDEHSSLVPGQWVMITRPVQCTNFTSTSSALSLKGKGSLTVSGNVSVVPGTSFTKFKGDLVFASSNKAELSIPVELNSDLIFKQPAGEWVLKSDLNTKQNIYLEQGSLTTNGQQVTCYSFEGSGTASRGLDITNSKIHVQTWNVASSQNMSFASDNSYLQVEKNINRNFNTGGLKYASFGSSPKSVPVSATVTNATCPINSSVPTGQESKLSDGAINVLVNGGVGTYYVIVKDATDTEVGRQTGNNLNFTGLGSGLYFVYAHTGSYTGPVAGGAAPTVGPGDLVVDIQVATNITCASPGNDLQLTAATTGGTTPYASFDWTSNLGYSYSGQTTLANLSQANYVVKVTDANGCFVSDNFYYYPLSDFRNDYFVIDGRPLDITITLATPTASCFGEDNGQITVSGVSGGTPDGGPYQYAAVVTTVPPVGGDYGAGSTISNLAPGNYDVWVKDGNGCEKKYGSVVTVGTTPKPVPDAGLDGSTCANTPYTVSGATVDANTSSYSWTTNGGGTLSGATTLTPTYTPVAADLTLPGGIVTLTLEAFGIGSCSAFSVTDFMNLTIKQVPAPTAGPDKSICGTTGSLDGAVSPMGGVLTWTKVAGPGTVSFGNPALGTSSVTLTAPVTYGIYTFRLTEVSGGCTGFDEVTITFDQSPSASVPNGSVCIGDTYSLSAATASHYASLLWTTSGTGTFNDPTSLNPIYDPSAADETLPSVTLTLTANGNGVCGPAIANMTLSIYAVPTPFAGADKSTCGISYNISDATRSIGGSTLTWTKISGPAGGTVSFSSSITLKPTVTLSSPITYGTYQFQLEEKVGSLCTGTDVVSITYDQGPSVSVPATPAQNTCKDIPYTVPAGFVTYSHATLLWSDNGAGSITGGGTTATPTYTPGIGELATITMTAEATGTGACILTQVYADLNLTINDLPTPTFTAEVTSACEGSTGNVYTTQSGNSNYVWTVSPGGVFTTPINTYTVQVTWNTAGPQWVKVNYDNAAGCTATSPATSTVTVNTRPTPSFIAEVTDVCAGTAGNVYTTQAGMSNYVWTVPSGGTKTAGGTSIDASITITWTTSGTKNLTVNYNDANGCDGAAPATSTVTVHALPTPTFLTQVTSACVGSTGNVYTTESGKTNYDWTFSAGGTKTAGGSATDPSITITWNTAGPQWVRVNYEDAIGCSATSPTESSVTVNDLPVPTFLAEVTSACEGSTGNVYTTESGKTNYAWSVSGGGIITSGNGTSSIQVTWNTAGPQTVSVNYDNAAGCTATSPAVSTVTVNSNPTADLSVNPVTTCKNEDVALDGNPSGGSGTYTTHAWSGTGAAYLDDPNIQTPTFNSPTPNTYNLTYTVTDDNGCSGSDNMTMTVTDGPSVYAGADAPICYDGTYTISDASASNYTSILWSTSGDGTFDNTHIEKPTYTPGTADQAAGTVTLTLTASSATCSNVADDMVLTITPELIASVGGTSPFNINVATTKITVAIWATHPDITQLSFYLVAPDGVKQMKLYSYNSVTDGCAPWDVYTTDIDSLVFSLNVPGSSGPFNLCDFALTTDPITGQYDPAESWNIFNTLDPAEGGWSLRVEDDLTGSEGTLTRARISFKDTDVHTGLQKEIIFDSKAISYPIEDESTTTYVVPIGLRTSCTGACDAHAIATAIGGTGPYTYEWETGTTGDTEDLCGGDYHVTVTDALGCTSIATVSVLEPDPVLITVTATDVDCFGESTGSVKATMTQGVGTPTYKWNDAANSTTQQVNNLPAGDYTVTVSDGNSCPAIATVTVHQPLAALATLVVVVPTNCNSATGTITLTPSGGTSPYSYLWDHDGGITNEATSLAVGNYRVVISDSKGCSLDTTIIMVDKGNMVISGFTMLTNISCHNNCDGEIQVDFTGGTGNYTYNWSGAGLTGTSQSLTNVCGDSTYYITVTDANTSCSTSGSHVISQPDSVKMQLISQTDVLCFGDSTGTAEVTGTGGTGIGTYTYVWYTAATSDINFTPTPDNLPYGKVYVNIQDANGCSYTDSIFIDQPVDALTATTSSTATGCGAATGTATVTPLGGAGSYTYLWDDPAASTTATATDLAVGIYHVVVTDANGCTLNEQVEVTTNSTLDVTITNIKDANCNGACDGQATAVVTGGTGIITYAWSSIDNTADAVALCAGDNYVTVTDDNLCSKVAMVTIGEPTPLLASYSVNHEPLCAGSADGEAQVSASGGTPLYTFTWPDLYSDQVGLRSDLAAGSYIVTVSDAHGCLVNETVTLTDPQPITFNISATPTNCGDSVGTATVSNITGGTGNYSVHWTSPLDSVQSSITNLWVDTYFVKVTDGNNCEADSFISVPDTSTMAVSIDSVVNVSCNGGNNGEAFASAINGTGPYTFTWSTGDTGAHDSSLFAGAYTVHAVDIKQCARDTMVVITEPTPITNTFVYTQPIVCHGDTEASFYAAVRGGIWPYAYSWTKKDSDFTSADSLIENAGVGWYYLMATDINSCIYNDSIEIFEPDSIQLTLLTGPTHCPDSTGWAQVSVIGGVPPYTYHWTVLNDPTYVLAGNNQDLVSNLWVDLFLVEVKDSLGCTSSEIVEITDDSGLDFSTEIISLPTCLTINNGSARVYNIDNGIAPYSYSWNNMSEVTDTAFYLPVGSSSILVSDGNGCKKVTTIEMKDDSVLRIDYIDARNDYSNAGELPNGKAEVYIIGGKKEYTYYWENENGTESWTTQKIIQLSEGNYFITVTDALSPDACVVTGSTRIEQDTLQFDTLELVHINCYGNSTGRISIQGRGGYPGAQGDINGYDYLWSSPAWGGVDSVGSSISNLKAGWYYLTITEKLPGTGSLTDSIELINLFEPYSVEVLIDSTNCTNPNGSLTIDKSKETGGKTPFTYNWTHEGWTADSIGQSIQNLEKGFYKLTVLDSLNCSYTKDLFLPDSSKMVLDINTYKVSCFGRSDGKVDLTPNNGIEPYQYLWVNEDATQSWIDQDLVSIIAGNYFVTVTDLNGCIRSSVGLITQPDPVTFNIAILDTIACYGDTDGSIVISKAKGGNGEPFTYQLVDLVEEQSDSTFRNLSVDQYNIIVKDADGDCRADSLYTFYSLSPQIIPEFTILDTTSCNKFANDGRIEVNVSAGYFNQVSSTLHFDAVQYEWNNSGNQISDNIYSEAFADTNTVIVYTSLFDGLPSCQDVFKINMPSVVDISVINAIGSGLKADYFCPADTINIYGDAILYKPDDLIDSIVWSIRDPELETSWSSINSEPGQVTGTIVHAIDKTDQYYKITGWYKECRDEDSVFVGRYAIDTLSADLTSETGGAIKLSANKPDVAYSSGESFDYNHAFTWIANNDQVTWITTPDLDTVSAKPGITTLFTVYDSIRIVQPVYSDAVCVLSDTISRVVLSDIIPPTIFTPNGDGTYDLWVIPGIEGYTNVSVQIFNRWGGLVWDHSGDYQGNEWDGTNRKGKPLPSGTYYYILKYSDETKTTTQSGSITILR